MLHDIRHAMRLIWKTRGVTAVAVLSLALGIGANAALFSVVDAMLLRQLPVKEPGRLVLFSSVSGDNFRPGSYTGSASRDASGALLRTSFWYRTYVRMRDQESAVSDLVAFGNVSLNVSADGLTEVASGQAVSGNYFDGLGVAPFAGRTLNDGDDQAGASPVAVISYRYWQRRFGGDLGVVGKQINLNNVAFTVAGVTAPGFEGTMQAGSTQDVTIPIAWESRVSPVRSYMKGTGSWWLRIVGRLKSGAALDQAQASLEASFVQSVHEYRDARRAEGQNGPDALRILAESDYPRLAVESGSQGEMNTRRGYAPPLYLLLGVVGLVLLVACANVANLLLARAASRQREIAVRLALGASRRRLIRQLLTESMMLAVLGGGLGILIALWLKDGLLAVTEWGGRGMAALNPSLDLRVFAFTAALSLLTGILFGIAPAWRSTRIDLTPALKDSGRNSSGAARSWLSKALIVGQVAVSLGLLVGAGLLLRTLINLHNVEAGFNQQNLLLFRLDPGLIGYKDARLMNLIERLAEGIEAVPGVRSTTFSRMPLLARGTSDRSVYLPGAAASADGEVKPSGLSFLHQVRENFLESMGIPLLAGRDLTDRDSGRAPKVAVVNQTFARQFFGDQPAIGKRFSFDSNVKEGVVEIVGVCADARYARQRDDVPPTSYLPWRQELDSLNSVTFEARTIGDPRTTVAAIREAVREVDPNLPVSDIRTQVEQADQTLAQERLFAKLLSFFGMLAQLLASIGLYGVMAYGVSQRTQEIGIRMALGANRTAVLKMILRQGMLLTLTGVALGTAGSYVLTKYLASLTDMLFGVRATDPLTYAGAAILLTSVTLLACFIPARRATRVDPMVALRYE